MYSLLSKRHRVPVTAIRELEKDNLMIHIHIIIICFIIYRDAEKITHMWDL